MIVTVPQPVQAQSLQSGSADAPTYIEVVKAILAQTLNDQGIGFERDDADV
ncbi:MAG: hypothetical protein HC812_06705 [Leptolyngbya sp. RL_3_1]|nr:hypothetical protein [Leptolyngbya sp. RL_3_1]